MARARISHWARLQHRWVKKFFSSRAFMVQMSLVAQALGSTNRASSMAFFSALRAASFSGRPWARKSFLCRSCKSSASR